ncbi:MAG: hypothetical protein LPK19_17725 [Hymenobacteraceae bacterium]|nr:hypothetical protein [Hymenobacteraceae bacterium]MDX5398096.1 hypothetical protein [Hymenobacteraceae bacterium]MDX5514168.1 hypothetical protein [Hymenobacteraceae bacterium]
MVKLTCYIFLVLSLVSCSAQNEELDLLIKKDICVKSIGETEKVFSQIKYYFKVDGHRAEDSVVVADCEKIVSWRRKFMKEKNLLNLLTYSDSVEERYKKLQFGNANTAMYATTKIKNNIKNLEDSLVYYNTLYLASVMEKELLGENARKIGAIRCFAGLVVPSFLDKQVYNVSDTVFLTFTTDEQSFSDTVFDFTNVVCKSKENISLKAKVIKSGPNFILMFHPTNKGVYKIGGHIILKQEGNYNSTVRIENKFKVV